ncbi:hypothetical protein [Haliangium sp.]|uniref:hypothetical protein n=1 Tax=Haliangium sp. TaxID=2663208 RepID=UPI003D0D3961
MSYSPYQKKSPGDVLKLQDWLEIQQRIKEELRDHRHLGVDRDGDVAPAQIGPRIGRGAFAPGAVTTGKLAKGSVGEVALAPGAIRAEHFDPDQRLPESYLAFRSTDGHDHDGVRSRALPAAVVGTRQIRDEAISEMHLDGAPRDDDLTPEEESYAQGRAFTPGAVLRAARQLIEHTGLDKRPLLRPDNYRGIAGNLLLVKGFRLNELLDRDDGELAGEFVYMEIRLEGESALTREPIIILDQRRLQCSIPLLGDAERSGLLRAVRGSGTADRPYLPVSNTIRFTYVPAEVGDETPPQ